MTLIAMLLTDDLWPRPFKSYRCLLHFFLATLAAVGAPAHLYANPGEYLGVIIPLYYYLCYSKESCILFQVGFQMLAHFFHP